MLLLPLFIIRRWLPRWLLVSGNDNIRFYVLRMIADTLLIVFISIVTALLGEGK